MASQTLGGLITPASLGGLSASVGSTRRAVKAHRGHSCHACAGTELTLATCSSAPGLGSPRCSPCHICTGTALIRAVAAYRCVGGSRQRPRRRLRVSSASLPRHCRVTPAVDGFACDAFGGRPGGLTLATCAETTSLSELRGEPQYGAAVGRANSAPCGSQSGNFRARAEAPMRRPPLQARPGALALLRFAIRFAVAGRALATSLAGKRTGCRLKLPGLRSLGLVCGRAWHWQVYRVTGAMRWRWRRCRGAG